jgi:YTH domain-containing protein 1
VEEHSEVEDEEAAEAAAAATALSVMEAALSDDESEEEVACEDEEERHEEEEMEEEETGVDGDTGERQSDDERSASVESRKYFIIKSRSEVNLNVSMEKGVWATQMRNEVKLRNAFDKGHEVLLIFSVNNSRHFQVIISRPGDPH